MPMEVERIIPKCFVLAPLLGELGLKIAQALNKVSRREFGADEELLSLYWQIPGCFRALA